MSKAHSLLIVDDEAALRRALRSSLVASGFEVVEARGGEEALEAMQQGAFDLILLDVNLGAMDGHAVCKRARAELQYRGGIIMVTVRDSENDKVTALEAGADDFVTKPFRTRELLARVKAVLRRVAGARQEKRDIVRVGDLHIDLDRHLVKKGGVEIHLSPKEYEVLAMLARAEGAPVTHRKLLATIWGAEYGNELDYLRSYVKMLRAKLEDNPSKPVYLITEPWVGYRLLGSEEST